MTHLKKLLKMTNLRLTMLQRENFNVNNVTKIPLDYKKKDGMEGMGYH